MENSKKICRKTTCFAKSFFKKTQELIEISQINLKIMQLKNKLERKMVKLGNSIYKKQKEDGVDGLNECLNGDVFSCYCKEIDEIYEEIEKLEEELKEIKKDSICVMEYEKKLEKKACLCEHKKNKEKDENSTLNDEKEESGEFKSYSNSNEY